MQTEYKSRGYLLDNYRLFHLSDAQGTRVEAHYHEFCKLLLLRSGSGGYMVDGSRYALEPGDIVFIGSHCVHRPEFQRGDPYERVILYISPEFLRAQSAPGCPLEDCFSGDFGHVLRPDAAQKQRLFSLVAQLEGELSGGAYGREVLGNGLLLQLLVELGRCLRSRTLPPQAPILSAGGRTGEILRYIEGHLTEDLTIDQISEEFYISKYHMMRLFRRETGRSIHDYLCERRLLRARDLLSQGMSATESCFRSGFRSYSSFTRAYGKRFGTTPTGRSSKLEETYE